MTRNAGKAFSLFRAIFPARISNQNVKYDNKAASQQPKLFDDDSKIKSENACERKSRWTLLPGILPMILLEAMAILAWQSGILVNIICGRNRFFIFEEPFNTILPRLYTMHHRYITILLCRCYHNHSYKYDGNDSYDRNQLEKLLPWYATDNHHQKKRLQTVTWLLNRSREQSI